MSGTNAEITRLTAGLVDKIISPIIALLAAVALLVFVYGVVEYMWGMSTDIGEGKKHGRMHMLYGILGLFIIVGAYGILSIIGQVMCSGSLANCGK